ncbi:hypothetical protein M8J77_011204 [Diaphorina citri]|nr:hypothetical protein M8J77_011204 [Diaphorina citri]
MGSGKGFTWVKIQDILLMSVYTSGNDRIEEMDATLREISATLRTKGKDAIIGGDFNAKSPEWGETRLDGRGRKLSEWIAMENLITQNIGNTPTFKRRDQESIIDLTLSTEGISERIVSWKVLDDLENGSDHQYIYFEVRQLRTPGNSNNTAPLGWNINTLNLETLRRIVNNAARQTQFDEFDEEDLSHLAKEICRKAMKKKSNKGRKSAYWWNEDIRDKRQLCTQKRRTYTRNRRRTDETDSMRMYNEYREARKSLNIEIAKSKKKGWLDLCEELKKDIWGLGYKIVRRKVGKKLPILPPEVRETAINKLFPTHPIHVWENTTPRPRLVITIDELVNTAHNMKAKKAPGPDEVPPKIIKEMVMESPDLFIKVLNKLINEEEFPEPWKEARVLLIEKPKKLNTDPNSYRPICLLNTLGKLYEGILNTKLVKELEDKNLLSPRQFGFRAGRSTVHAINEIIKIAKEEMVLPCRKRKLCLMITLDIKNAFNSASWAAIITEMIRLNINNSLIETIKSYLSKRKLVGENFDKNMTAGVPQGSIIGPTLWNILYNSVLDIPVPEDSTLIAYADDLAVVIKAKTEEELERKSNEILAKIKQWMTEKQLEIAPTKSEAITLIGKKRCRPLKIEIEGQAIEEKPSIKYLGVMLDKSLKFGPHVDYVSERAANSMSSLARIMPRVGGAGEAKRRVLQNAAESILLYAAPVWADCLKIKKRRDKLLKAQRIGTLRVTSAYRTTSTEALTVISGVIPIDLILEERAITFQKSKEDKERQRENTIQKWQARWSGSTKGAWTRKLIPEIKPWLERRHGEVGYYITQLLSGHGNFQYYKHRFKINEDPICMYCSDEDTAEHTLFHCVRWESEREQLEHQINSSITPENLTGLMLRDQYNWSRIENFMTHIMKHKETTERLLAQREAHPT